MGAGLTVAPNTIDFNDVFENLDDKIVENAAVVGTVVGVIILYIPLLILCRKLDKKDKIKVGLINYNKPACTYSIIEFRWLLQSTKDRTLASTQRKVACLFVLKYMQCVPYFSGKPCR